MKYKKPIKIDEESLTLIDSWYQYNIWIKMNNKTLYKSPERLLIINQLYREPSNPLKIYKLTGQSDKYTLKQLKLLENAGYIKISKHQDKDKRKKFYELTDLGLNFVNLNHTYIKTFLKTHKVAQTVFNRIKFKADVKEAIENYKKEKIKKKV